MFNPQLSYHRAPGSQQRARTSYFNPNTAGNVSKEKPGTKHRNSPAGWNKRGRSLPTSPSHTDTHQVSEGVSGGRRGFGGAALPAGAAGPVLTHPSAGGGAARTSAGSGVPSGGSGPAASPGPRNPQTARGNEAAAAAVGAPRSVPPPAGQTHFAAAPRRGRSRGRERRERGDRRAGPASAPRRGPAQRRLPGRRGSEG